MRELVLNHASVLVPGSNRHEISAWLRELAEGMRRLVEAEVVLKSLRTAHALYETRCLPGYSLFDAYLALQRGGFREEFRLLMGLADKQPLLMEVGPDVKDRFLACVDRTLPSGDGEPLVFCAVTDGVAVGFPSAPEWDRDRAVVHFDELLPDETNERRSEGIDQLTRTEHAEPICARHRHQIRAGSDPVSLWENRAAAFPNLMFGPEVEDNLRRYAHLFSTIVGKLDVLDASARDWANGGGPMPNWKTKVTSESNSVMNNSALRKARRFPSHHGTHKLFEWHARFGSNGRIHLRFDPELREVEVGYIGSHLPLR